MWGLYIGGEGGRAYSSSKLFSWTPVGYSRKRYRNLAARLERNGLVQHVLVAGEMNFRLTAKGKQSLVNSYPILELKAENWDGFWRVVIFDVPETDRKIRDDLRHELVKLKFGWLQNSIYISAFEYSTRLINFIEARGLKSKVLLLESKQKHLGDPLMLAEKVWQLGEIKKAYCRVEEKLTTRFGIKNEVKRENFFKRVYQEYLYLLIREPWLPKDLLFPDWPAEKIKKYILRSGVIKE